MLLVQNFIMLPLMEGKSSRFRGVFNSYTTAARDFADIYTQSPRAAGPRAAGVYVSKIPSSCGISDIHHLGHTHLIGERTNENLSRLFYTVASENRLWFYKRWLIAIKTLSIR